MIIDDTTYSPSQQFLYDVLFEVLRAACVGGPPEAKKEVYRIEFHRWSLEQNRPKWHNRQPVVR